MYNARIELDSISESGHRLTTFVLEYPRFIHSEFMTYRMFSRNAASSRAVPISRMIDRVMRDPAMPLAWGSNRKGMSAGPELRGTLASASKQTWLKARDAAVAAARDLETFGVHKQLANRVLEPFMFIETIVTANEDAFQHMIRERAHESAQPEFQWLALEMRRLLDGSKPTTRPDGEWHMPFLRPFDMGQLSDEEFRMVSAARCARVSYLNHDGVRSVPDDLTLYYKLIEPMSRHLSPLEHVAMAGGNYGNVRGWTQLRGLIS